MKKLEKNTPRPWLIAKKNAGKEKARRRHEKSIAVGIGAKACGCVKVVVCSREFTLLVQIKGKRVPKSGELSYSLY